MATMATVNPLREKAQQIARNTGLLDKLMGRQTGRCFWCGISMVRRAYYDIHGEMIDAYRKATIDHVHPLAEGGATNDKNCVAACQACNTLRGKYNTKVWQGEMQELHTRRKAAETRAAHYKRRCSQLEQWMTRQREDLRATTDRADMLAATVDMTPESLLTKLRRWFGGNR